VSIHLFSAYQFFPQYTQVRFTLSKKEFVRAIDAGSTPKITGEMAANQRK
jgi:hypothetical protein